MTSPVRPVLTQSAWAILLCCVIALGHAPAWMHVATCGCTHVDPAAQLTITSCSTGHDHCSHCCGHVDDDDSVLADQDQKSGHEHDSDSCAICQSLASSCGVPWQLDLLSDSELVFQFAYATPDESLLPLWIVSAHPRGPPVAL